MLDLFGEIPVTEREIMLWLWSVPTWHNIHSSEAKRASYVKNWDVVGKIRREKAKNGLQSIFGDESCPHCGQQLENPATLEFDRLADELAALKARPLAKVIPLRLVLPPANGGNHVSQAPHKQRQGDGSRGA